MLSIYKVKPSFQKLLTPVLEVLYRWNIRPNQITMASIFLSLGIGVAFWLADGYHFLFLVLPLGLLVRMGLNALDGMMAKNYNMQSKKGEVLNEVGDIISDMFIFFPLMKFEKDIIYVIVIFICLSLINEFSGLIGKVVGKERCYDGPMGKSDRAFAIGLYGIASFLNLSLLDYSVYFFLCLILLIILSSYSRIQNALS